ncbi:heterokaryon incompatibility protein-domain-containing protein [Cerioporus squamosus]|nr:heterokaryon incompatibility protein-domain-containing protein [Cerioporus squamosus]
MSSSLPKLIPRSPALMWFLRTSRAELQHFSQPPQRYAILSHVWGDDDLQSFQDVQALHTHAVCGKDNPRARASPKIRGCCIYAEAQGFEWLWIDTCCIDKSSSAELSEAINSMYQWYARATVCYVYLHDVSAEADPSARTSPFRRSKWFTRGWTLQELIAPKRVCFLSHDWVYLGDKALFARLLEQITGIDVDVLTFHIQPSSVPIAKRMQWASQRKTTRIEDEAYSLMGIFGVHMATIYGEGRQAFRRLQEEIMKNIADHTLLTWGLGLPGDHFAGRYLIKPMVRCSLLARSAADFWQPQADVLTTSVSEYWSALERAGLPSDHSTGHTEVLRSCDPASFQIPEFSLTSHGIRARLPIIDIHYRRPVAGKPATHAVALLACTTRHRSTLIGLLLYLLDDSGSYSVGWTSSESLGSNPRTARDDPRWLYFEPTPDFIEKFFRKRAGQALYQWKNIYITQDQVPDWEDPYPIARVLPPTGIVDVRLGRCFLPVWTANQLQSYGFIPLCAPNEAADDLHTVRTLDSASQRTVTYAFFNVITKELLYIHLGYCRDDRSEVPRLWLTVDLSGQYADSLRRVTRAHLPQHGGICNLLGPAHVHQWALWDRTAVFEHWRQPRRHRLFGDALRSVRIYMRNWATVSSDPPWDGYDPSDTFDNVDGLGEQLWEIHVRLSGSAFDRLAVLCAHKDVPQNDT